MDYKEFLDIVSQSALEHSDGRYNVKVLLGDEQKYSSPSFGNDYDFRLNAGTEHAATLLVSSVECDENFEVGKATLFYKTREELLDCECWLRKNAGSDEWLEKVKFSQCSSAEKLISKKYYIMAGYGQTSVQRDKLTLANRFRALDLYLSVLDKWIGCGGGLMIEPAGVCYIQNEKKTRLDSNDVDFKYLGTTAKESLPTEKLCKKQALQKIDGVYQRYTLGAVCVR